MNTGRTLVELAQELERQQQNKRDFMAPTQKSSIVIDGDTAQLVMAGVDDKFSLTRTAESQIALFTGIPQKYFDRMRNDAPELLASNVNHWFQKNPTPRLVRTLDLKARAFLSNRYRTIDNFDVAEAVLPVMRAAGDIEIMSSDITENHMYIKAVTHRVTVEVQVGDIVQAGVVISNSEVGAGAIKIEPFVYRLVCLNGMVAGVSLKKYHIGRVTEELESAYEVFRSETVKADQQVFMMKLADTVQAAFDPARLTEIVDRLRDSTTQKILAPADEVVEVITKHYGFSNETRSSVLRNLIEDSGSFSRWKLANAVTAVANDRKDYEEATQLERIGGDIAFMDAPQWTAQFERKALQASA